jgi:hypothetical protein
MVKMVLDVNFHPKLISSPSIPCLSKWHLLYKPQGFIQVKCQSQKVIYYMILLI